MSLQDTEVDIGAGITTVERFSTPKFGKHEIAKIQKLIT